MAESLTNTPILIAAARLGVLERERDQVRDGSAEASRIEDEMIAIEDRLATADPTTTAEAVVVMMIGVTKINAGNSSMDGQALIELGELAIRRAIRVVARQEGLDLAAMAGGYYLPKRLAPVYA